MNYSNIVELKNLKQAIKQKFKTLKHFAYSADIDYYLLNKFFGRKLGSTNMDETKVLVQNYLKTTECKPFVNDVLPEEAEYIRKRILINYRSMSQFITDNPQYSKSFVSNVINGKRKRRDARFHKFRDDVNGLKTSIEEILRT